MDYHLLIKLSTIDSQVVELLQELQELEGGRIWDEIAHNYSGHPLVNIDEYISDKEAGRI